MAAHAACSGSGSRPAAVFHSACTGNQASAPIFSWPCTLPCPGFECSAMRPEAAQWVDGRMRQGGPQRSSLHLHSHCTPVAAVHAPTCLHNKAPTERSARQSAAHTEYEARISGLRALLLLVLKGGCRSRGGAARHPVKGKMVVERSSAPS